MDKRTGGLLPPVGLSALLCIFAVLCLTVFALLSAATVRADTSQRERMQQAVLDYYAADAQAQRILADLCSGQRPEQVEWKQTTACYQVPIAPGQTLMVEVVVNGSDYTVVRWQAVNTQPWQADEQLDVWNAEQ